MKSLAIAGLALLSGSALAKSSVQGNNNNGILSVDASKSHMGNNNGIINVFGGDGNHNIAGNKGFVNVLPFHIVRDDDVAADDELYTHVQGNNNNGILSVDASSSHMGNNNGILNVFGGDGNHNIAGNKGFVNVLPFHIVRGDDEADNELCWDELIIKNQQGGKVTINNWSHDDEIDNELHSNVRLDVANQKYDAVYRSGVVTVHDDELFSFFNGATFDISGNQGQVNMNTDTPAKDIKNVNVSNNHGQITQTDSNGKTTMIEDGKTEVNHSKNSASTQAVPTKSSKTAEKSTHVEAGNASKKKTEVKLQGGAKGFLSK